MSDDDEDQGAALTGAAEAAPAPMLAGTFALYQSPDGGFVLVTDIPGRGVEQKIIPGKVVKLITSGVGARMFGSIFGPGED